MGPAAQHLLLVGRSEVKSRPGAGSQGSRLGQWLPLLRCASTRSDGDHGVECFLRTYPVAPGESPAPHKLGDTGNAYSGRLLQRQCLFPTGTWGPLFSNILPWLMGLLISVQPDLEPRRAAGAASAQLPAMTPPSHLQCFWDMKSPQFTSSQLKLLFLMLHLTLRHRPSTHRDCP